MQFIEFFEYLKDGRLIKGVFRSEIEDRLKSSGEDIELHEHNEMSYKDYK